MDRAEFSRRILGIGGTYADVNRLDEEGRKTAEEVFTDEWKNGHIDGVEPRDVASFSEWCYRMGRQFIVDNYDNELNGWEDDLFHLEHPENAEQQRKINRWHYLARNIANIGLVLCDVGANMESAEQSEITWADIESAEKILEDLREICAFGDYDAKEV